MNPSSILVFLATILLAHSVNATFVIRQETTPSPQPNPFATALACRRINAAGAFISKGRQTLLVRLDDFRKFSPFDLDRGTFNITCVNSGLLDSVMETYSNMLGQPGCQQITTNDCTTLGGQNGRRERCRCIDTAPSCFNQNLINQITALCPPIAP